MTRSINRGLQIAAAASNIGAFVNRALISEADEGSLADRGKEPSFFTNYAHVLLLVGQNPDLRVRDLSLQTGLTERGVQRIIDVLQDHGYLSVSKHGKRNHYELQVGMLLNEGAAKEKTVGDLIRFISE